MRILLCLMLVSALGACLPSTVTGGGNISTGAGGSTIGLGSGGTSSSTTATANASSGSTGITTASDTTSAATGTTHTSTNGGASSTSSSTSGATSGAAATTGVADPRINGRYSVVQGTAEITNTTTNDTIPIIYDYPVKSPDAGSPAPGSCPIVIFAHGFLIDASAYELYASRLSSFGYVVVLPNYPDANEVITSANDDNFVDDLMSGVDFALGSLPESDPKVTPLVNASAVGISGHSLGGKLAILAAEKNPSAFQASIDFDPVDDTSCGANCPSASASLGSLSIPTAFLGETTDQSGGGIFSGACAPVSENFQVFYAGAVSPSYQGTVTGAGAESFLDNQSGCGFGLGCSNCTSANGTATLDISHAMLVAFYERYLRGNTGYDVWLNGSASTAAWVTPGELTLVSK